MSLKNSASSQNFPLKDFSPPDKNPDLKSQISFLTQKIQTLEERLLAKTRETESLLLTNKNPSSSSKLNDPELFSLKSKITDLEQNNLLLTRENDYYRRITTNKDNIELKTTKIVELEQNFSKLLSENSKLNELCKSYMKENDDLKSKKPLNNGYDSLRLNVYNEISEMSQKIVDLEKKAKEYRADNEFLAYKIKEKELDRKNEMESVENSNLKLINDNRVLLSEKEKVIEELKSLKDKNSVLSLENHDLETRLNNIKKELESEKMRSLETEKKYQKNLENLEENTEKKFEISRLLGEIEKKNMKINELEGLMDRHIRDMDELKEVMNGMRERLNEMEKEGNEKTEERSEMKQDLKEKKEAVGDFENLIEKCNRLKEKNKILQGHLKEKIKIIETLQIYQEKYETLFQETRGWEETNLGETNENLNRIVLLSAENDRLHNLIHEYMNYKDLETKSSSQYNKNLKEYNNLCILLKDLERKNFQLIDENASLKMVNDQKTKEINRLMIENSQVKMQNIEIDRFYQQSQPVYYYDTPRQEHKQHPQTNFFHYY